MTTSSANLKAMSFDKLSKLRDQVDAILNAKVAEERRAMQSRLNELDRLGVNGDACQGRRPWLSRRRCSKIFQSRKPRGDLGRAGAEATLARREARVRQEARGFPHWGAGKESAGEVQEGASRREGLSDLGMSAWLPLSTIGSPTRFRPVAERRKRRKAVPPFVGGHHCHGAGRQAFAACAHLCNVQAKLSSWPSGSVRWKKRSPHSALRSVVSGR